MSIFLPYIAAHKNCMSQKFPFSKISISFTNVRCNVQILTNIRCRLTTIIAAELEVPDYPKIQPLKL